MSAQTDLEAQLTALKNARASGAQVVRYVSNGNERSVTYRSVDDLNKAIAAVESDLAGVSGTSVVRTFKFTSDKDL